VSSAAVPPLLLADLDLAWPLTGLTSNGHSASRRERPARLLLRLFGQPIGLLETRIPGPGLSPQVLAHQVVEQLGDVVAGHLEQPRETSIEALLLDGLSTHARQRRWQDVVRSPLPTATIVINTCGHRPDLFDTVQTALDQDYPSFEVVVVDNRPQRSELPGLLKRRFGRVPNLTYRTEVKPGLANGRNRGLHSTTAEIVAFTDDDVILDRSWLGSLVGGFAVSEDVACVTGLILPKQLATYPQLWLEEFGGFRKGFERRVWDCAENRPDDRLYPYRFGVFGSGANAAFKRSLLLELGAFDEALGTGTPARGGEDLDIYTRVVLEGFKLVYEPAALLRHAHHAGMSELRRQIFGYGVSVTAVLTTHLLTGPLTRRAVLRRIPAGLLYLLSPRSAKNERRSAAYPPILVLTELLGMVVGPAAYLRSRWRLRRARRGRP